MAQVGNSPIVWVDIPVIDLDRASAFYSAVLGATLNQGDAATRTHALFPQGEANVGGCLYRSEIDVPSERGPLIYLNCSGRLDEAIAAVEANGGRLLEPKHSIAPHGDRAVALDSEGNRIALHSA